MEYIANYLGLQLPTLRARDALRQNQYSSTTYSSISEAKIVWGANCFQDMWDMPPKSKFNDDDTASLSDCDDSSFSSSSSLSCCVSFAAPLVTEVHSRPYTLQSEKQELFYSEADFRQFRMDFRRSLCQKRSSVSFSDTVVSYTLPAVENKHEIYYSADELKEFLEDFILSLDEKNR